MFIARITRMTASATVCNTPDTHHITYRDAFDLGAHFAHHTHHLVARHHWEHASTQFVTGRHQIGVTDAAELQIQSDIPRP
jgi:hypothetical protein